MSACAEVSESLMPTRVVFRGGFSRAGGSRAARCAASIGQHAVPRPLAADDVLDVVRVADGC